jgi:hypothetical protein
MAALTVEQMKTLIRNDFILPLTAIAGLTHKDDNNAALAAAIAATPAFAAGTAGAAGVAAGFVAGQASWNQCIVNAGSLGVLIRAMKLGGNRAAIAANLPAIVANADAANTTAASIVTILANGAFIAAGGAAALGAPNSMKSPFDSVKFKELVTKQVDLAPTNVAQAAVENAVAVVIGTEIQNETERVRAAVAGGGAGAVVNNDVVVNATFETIRAARDAGVVLPANAAARPAFLALVSAADAARAAVIGGPAAATAAGAGAGAIENMLNAALAATAPAAVAGVVPAAAVVDPAVTPLITNFTNAWNGAVPRLPSPTIPTVARTYTAQPNYTQAVVRAVNTVAGGPNEQRDRTRIAVLQGELGLVGGPVLDLFESIFNDSGYFLNTKTNRLIYTVPKSDELKRRMVAPIFANKSGITSTAATLPARISGEIYNSMPASDAEVYNTVILELTKEEEASFAAYDKFVDELRAALSEGPSIGSSGIKPQSIVIAPVKTSQGVFSKYPENIKTLLKERRKSDPSNPINTMNRIRISMNGGANNMRGGASSKTGPLYPKFVMHGGSHPLAVMEGGAAAAVAGPVRTSPNPVAVLDARIQELKAQYKAATNKNFDPALGPNIDNFTTQIYDNVKLVQDGLNVLANANKALAQYPVGLGMDASTFDEQKLKDISAQAEKINKDAQKASKQLTKLEQISDTLAELVAKSTPAKRV